MEEEAKIDGDKNVLHVIKFVTTNTLSHSVQEESE